MMLRATDKAITDALANTRTKSRSGLKEVKVPKEYGIDFDRCVRHTEMMAEKFDGNSKHGGTLFHSKNQSLSRSHARDALFSKLRRGRFQQHIQGYVSVGSSIRERYQNLSSLVSVSATTRRQSHRTSQC